MNIDIDKFKQLTKKWKEETMLYSNINMIEFNESYLEIMDMGKDILPHIFKDLRENGGFWFSALEKFTGTNPIKPEHKGIIKLMTEDWLKWEEENDYMIIGDD